MSTVILQSQNTAAPARVAVIVVDSGFSRESVARVKNLLGFMDLTSGISTVGQPMVQGQARELVLAIAEDPLNHGSIILDRLLSFDPDLPLVLVRAFNPPQFVSGGSGGGGGLIRTRFEHGQIAAAGWTEAYLWAQNICAQKGYLSVANFSFGGFHHAMDGTGWESFQLATVVGPGKPGHLLSAAAGPGDGRAIHASLTLEAGGTEVIHAYQEDTSTYNLLVDRLVDPQIGPQADPQIGPQTDPQNNLTATRDFVLEVSIAGQLVFVFQSKDLIANLWNGKQQLTFDVHGCGNVALAISLASGSGSCTPARFDVFISREQNARFSDFVDSELVSEPAVFAEVIAVGLKDGSYGRCRVSGIEKPEIFLSGSGPISFRTPEVTFALAQLLADDPTLDAPQARAQLHRLWCQQQNGDRLE